MSSENGPCWSCGAELSGGAFGRSESCPGCSADTRCCRNCRFYSNGTPNDCLEPMVEPVADKEKANFCELFRPGAGARTVGGGKKKESTAFDAKAAFDALFKKKEG